MKLEDLLKLIETVDKSSLDVFELNEGETSVKIKRHKPELIQVAPQPVAPAAASTPAVPAQAAAPADAAENANAPAHGVPNSKDIVSPLVGIFHELSGGKAVKIGDKLKKGEPVCLIEAMKLMNEINMPEDGEIVWIAAEEGSTVEYDQILLSYVKA